MRTSRSSTSASRRAAIPAPPRTAVPTSRVPRMPSQTIAAEAPTTHAKLLDWVGEIAKLTQPDAIHWCDGSAEEYDALAQALIEAGTFERLSDAKRPNSYLALSDPGDVARVEDRTFICSREERDAGPTNHWRDPVEMRDLLHEKFKGAMRGRTMYVVRSEERRVGHE